MIIDRMLLTEAKHSYVNGKNLFDFVPVVVEGKDMYVRITGNGLFITTDEKALGGKYTEDSAPVPEGYIKFDRVNPQEFVQDAFLPDGAKLILVNLSTSGTEAVVTHYHKCPPNQPATPVVPTFSVNLTGSAIPSV